MLPPLQAHLAPTQTASGQLVNNTPGADQLWSYLVQLAAAVRAAHAAGMAVRAACLHPSKVSVGLCVFWARGWARRQGGARWQLGCLIGR